MLRAGRVVLPLKMTSSISPPRIDLAEVSPMAQRSASTRFDLPQPFGPTMPGQAGIDQQFGGIDEGLEAGETKFGELTNSETTASWRRSIAQTSAAGRNDRAEAGLGRPPS